MTVDEGSRLTSLVLQALNELSILQRDIGLLQGQAATIRENQVHAASDSRAIHQTVTVVATDFAVLKQTVERIAPLVDEHERKHQRGLGIVWLIRSGWLLGGGLIVAAMAKLFGVKFGS